MRKEAVVIAGLHKGRIGNIVSLPWFTNMFHLLMVTLNVPANETEIRARYGKSWGIRIDELLEEMELGHGPREWINVWRWQIRRL